MSTITIQVSNKDHAELLKAARAWGYRTVDQYIAGVVKNGMKKIRLRNTTKNYELSPQS